MQRLAALGLVASALGGDGAGRALHAQALGDSYRYQSVSMYGCATLGTESFCETTRWKFAQNKSNPTTVFWAMVVPGVCAVDYWSFFTWSRPLPPGDCDLWAPRASAPNWVFSLSPSFALTTTTGVWYFCDGDPYCNTNPAILTQPTGIVARWFGVRTDPNTGLTDLEDYWYYRAHATPEPATLLLLATGLAGVGAAARAKHRRRRR